MLKIARHRIRGNRIDPNSSRHFRLPKGYKGFKSAEESVMDGKKPAASNSEIVP
jgi:hypothetical protein